MTISYIFILLFVVAFVNMAFGYTNLNRFLADTKVIDSSRTLELFKETVRKQMIMALVQMVLLGSTFFLGIYGIMTEKIGLLPVIFFNVVLLAVSGMARKNEKKAQSLSVNDPTLEQEYRDICHTWEKRPFPDF